MTVLEQDAYQAAFDAAPVCFVLTNTRSLAATAAAERSRHAADGLIAVAGRRGARIQLVSRSDSTLRGHVMAEVAALQATRRQALGRGFDGVLLVPAFLEAGRLTAGDIHWARSGGELVPAGQTEFARDAAFGYTASDLKEFISEKSAGRIDPAEVGASVSLADIRLGSPVRGPDLLAAVQDGTWVVVDATEYSDLDTVACGVLLAERAGRSFLFRTGPGSCRPWLAWRRWRRCAAGSLASRPPPRARPDRGGISRRPEQPGRSPRCARSAAARTSRSTSPPSWPAGPGGGGYGAAGDRGAEPVRRSLYTSRTRAGPRRRRRPGHRPHGLSGPVANRRWRAGRRARLDIAKGGITSHDVAVHGLGFRRAEVAGQLFPGMISVLRPIDAAAAAVGIPYVVFPGNVGDDQALAEVVAVLDQEFQFDLAEADRTVVHFLRISSRAWGEGPSVPSG